MTHLLLACEGRSEKKSEELEEKKSTKGLYAFPALTGGAKEEPDLPLSHTPRDVVVQGKDWYALTREAVCGGTLQKNAHNLTLSLEPERKFLLKDLEQKGYPSIEKILLPIEPRSLDICLWTWRKEKEASIFSSVFTMKRD